MERDALYARIDARVDEMVAAGAAEEVGRADAAGAGRDRALGARLRGAAARRRRGDEAPHAQLREAPADLDAPPSRACTRSSSARAAPPTPPQRIAHILAARPGRSRSTRGGGRSVNRATVPAVVAGRPCGLRAFRLRRARLRRAPRATSSRRVSTAAFRPTAAQDQARSRRACTTASRRSSTTSRRAISTATSSRRSSGTKGQGPLHARARPAQGRAHHPRPLQRPAHLRQDERRRDLGRRLGARPRPRAAARAGALQRPRGGRRRARARPRST